MTLPAPVMQKVKGLWIIREDLIEGGTKRRALTDILPTVAASEIVYPATANAKGQLALAHAGKDTGKNITLFIAKRKEYAPYTKHAAALGATIIEVPFPNFLNVVEKRARDYAAGRDAMIMPLGFAVEEFTQSVADIARALPIVPHQVWTAAASGSLTKGLQRAWSDADFHCVQYGKKVTLEGVTIYHAPEKFERKAKVPPPFPSTPNCDAKMWQFAREHAKPNALVWNL